MCRFFALEACDIHNNTSRLFENRRQCKLKMQMHLADKIGPLLSAWVASIHFPLNNCKSYSWVILHHDASSTVPYFCFDVMTYIALNTFPHTFNFCFISPPNSFPVFPVALLMAKVLYGKFKSYSNVLFVFWRTSASFVVSGCSDVFKVFFFEDSRYCLDWAPLHWWTIFQTVDLRWLWMLFQPYKNILYVFKGSAHVSRCFLWKGFQIQVHIFFYTTCFIIRYFLTT